MIRWVDGVDEQKLFLSVLSLGELEKGIVRLPESARKDELRCWLEQDLTARFGGRVIPIDAAVAGTWGRMQGTAELAGVKLPVIDALMAATAQVYRMPVVTRNVADFERCGITVFNPWGNPGF
ncbi:MAG: PIN domain-containing protein [Desulfuromonadales bacterium]